MRGRSLAALALASCLTGGAQVPAHQTILQRYLANPRFDWKCESLSHFEMCSPRSMAHAEVYYMARQAESSLQSQLKLAGAASYAPRIHLFLVESYARERQLVGAYAAGASEPSEHIVSVAAGHPETLMHELNHEVMTHLWGHSEPWIAEGLAAFVSTPDIDNDCRDLELSGRLQPLADLVNANWKAALTPSTISYPELGSFVKYLDTRFGMEHLKQVWKGGAAAIPRVYGESLADLEREWLRWL